MDGVGGLDGDGGLLAAVLGEFGRGLLDAGEELVHGQQDADEAGGGDGDLTGADLLAPCGQDFGGLLGGGVGVLEALGTGAGVGAAGVEDDGGQFAVGEDLLGPDDGGGLDAVGGEDSRGGAAGPGVDHEGQVRVAVLLDPGGDARRRESLRCGDAHCASPFSPRADAWEVPPSPPARHKGVGFVVVCRPVAARASLTERLQSWKVRCPRGARGRCSCSAPRRRRCPW